MTDHVRLGGGDRFQPADYVIGRYSCTPPAGTTLAEILHPEYFSNHLDRLRAGMEISVLSEDFKLDAKIRCMTVTKTTANMRVLAVYAGEGAAPAIKAEVGQVSATEVGFGGPHHRWRFTHNGTVIEHGFASKEEADAAAAAYEQKLNG